MINWDETITDDMRRKSLLQEYHDTLYPYMERFMALDLYGKPRWIISKDMTRIQEYDVVYPEWVKPEREWLIGKMDVIKKEFEERINKTYPGKTE